MINITEEFSMVNNIRTALNTKYLMFYSNSVYAIDDTIKGNFRFTDVNPLFSKIKDYTVFSASDLSEINKTHRNTKKPIIYISHNNSIVCDDCSIGSVINIDISKIFKLLSDTSFIFNSIPEYQADITNNDKLMKAVRSRATDPGEICVIAGTKYFMTLFYGLMKVNARDTLKLEIFDYKFNSFISKFTVGKPGFNVIHILRFIYK